MKMRDGTYNITDVGVSDASEGGNDGGIMPLKEGWGRYTRKDECLKRAYQCRFR